MSYPAIPYSPATLTHFLGAMIGAAREAGAIIRDGAARVGTLVWESKGPSEYLASDFFTKIDTASEQRIRAELQTALYEDFPGVPVLGEESWTGDAIPDGLSFLADPLDGTTNFLHGVPVYAVSIAALHDGVPIAGVILNAATDELYTVVRGFGANWNGMSIGVSDITNPARALIGTGIPFNGNADLDRYVRQLARVAAATAGIRRAGAAAIDLAWLAAGRYDGFWELHLSPWDIAAGILMIAEAGGVVTDLDGNPATVMSSPIVAGNRTMHPWLLETLQRADGRGDSTR